MEPLFATKYRKRSRYKPLVDVLQASPVNTWFAVALSDIAGDTDYKKQGNILNCTRRWFESGTVQTHVEDGMVFVRRVDAGGKRKTFEREAESNRVSPTPPS